MNSIYNRHTSRRSSKFIYNTICYLNDDYLCFCWYEWCGKKIVWGLDILSRDQFYKREPVVLLLWYTVRPLLEHTWCWSACMDRGQGVTWYFFLWFGRPQVIQKVVETTGKIVCVSYSVRNICKWDIDTYVVLRSYTEGKL